MDFVIIRNEVHGEGFDLFDKSNPRQKLLNDLGAKEIQVAQMPKWLVESLRLRKRRLRMGKSFLKGINVSETLTLPGKIVVGPKKGLANLWSSNTINVEFQFNCAAPLL